MRILSPFVVLLLVGSALPIGLAVAGDSFAPDRHFSIVDPAGLDPGAAERAYGQVKADMAKGPFRRLPRARRLELSALVARQSLALPLGDPRVPLRRYALILPDGSVFADSSGANPGGVEEVGRMPTGAVLAKYSFGGPSRRRPGGRSALPHGAPRGRGQSGNGGLALHHGDAQRGRRPVFTTDTGRVAVTDFMPVGRRLGAGTHDYVSRTVPNWLVRRIEGLDGEVELDVVYRPSLDFARRRPELVLADGRRCASPAAVPWPAG